MKLNLPDSMIDGVTLCKYSSLAMGDEGIFSLSHEIFHMGCQLIISYASGSLHRASEHV